MGACARLCACAQGCVRAAAHVCARGVGGCGERNAGGRLHGRPGASTRRLSAHAASRAPGDTRRPHCTGQPHIGCLKGAEQGNVLLLLFVRHDDAPLADAMMALLFARVRLGGTGTRGRSTLRRSKSRLPRPRPRARARRQATPRARPSAASLADGCGPRLLLEGPGCRPWRWAGRRHGWLRAKCVCMGGGRGTCVEDVS